MKRLAHLIVGFALIFAPVAAHADLKALAEAAKQEGELTWYIAHYTSEGAEDLGRGFTEKYGVKVNVVRTTAQVAYQRLLQDIKNNQTICDVFSSTDVGHYVRLKADGKFGELKWVVEAGICDSLKDIDFVEVHAFGCQPKSPNPLVDPLGFAAEQDRLRKAYAEAYSSFFADNLPDNGVPCRFTVHLTDVPDKAASYEFYSTALYQRTLQK